MGEACAKRWLWHGVVSLCVLSRLCSWPVLGMLVTRMLQASGTAVLGPPVLPMSPFWGLLRHIFVFIDAFIPFKSE
jgi:hypothetical protein